MIKYFSSKKFAVQLPLIFLSVAVVIGLTFGGFQVLLVIGEILLLVFLLYWLNRIGLLKFLDEIIWPLILVGFILYAIYQVYLQFR